MSALIKKQFLSYFPLKTDRLFIRIPQLSDSSVLFSNYTSDPEVTKFSAWGTHASLQETEQFIKSCLQKLETENELNFCICLLTDPTFPIGMCKIKSSSSVASIGYVLAKKYWRQGYATEAMQSICNLLFSTSSITIIEATTDPENIASQAVLKKLGFTYIQTIPQHMSRPQLSSQLRPSLIFQLKRS